jgi:hypothetical protein
MWQALEAEGTLPPVEDDEDLPLLPDDENNDVDDALAATITISANEGNMEEETGPAEEAVAAEEAPAAAAADQSNAEEAAPAEDSPTALAEESTAEEEACPNNENIQQFKELYLVISEVDLSDMVAAHILAAVGEQGGVEAAVQWAYDNVDEVTRWRDAEAAGTLGAPAPPRPAWTPAPYAGDCNCHDGMCRNAFSCYVTQTHTHTLIICKST